MSGQPDVIVKVIVGGQDVTARFDPRLISITCTESEGGKSDSCEIELDDRDGSIFLPPTGSEISVALGRLLSGVGAVFEGKTDAPRSQGSRSGLTISISAKSTDAAGKAKEAKHKHWDDKSLMDVLKDAGRDAGIERVMVDPGLAKITRSWWGMTNESFMSFGQRLAREVGGTFKIKNGAAMLSKKNGGSVSGLALPSVIAARGKNLISWDIEPVVDRERFGKSESEHYDADVGEWKSKKKDTADRDAPATSRARFPKADEDETDNDTDSDTEETDRNKGGGSATIDGDLAACAGATCIIMGARPGVDGTYRIESRTHTYSRSGWTTELTLKLPGDKTGKDDRKSDK